MSERLGLHFSAKEWIGGCFDLAGEIGRFCVASATNRDINTVRQGLATLYGWMDEMDGWMDEMRWMDR